MTTTASDPLEIGQRVLKIKEKCGIRTKYICEYLKVDRETWSRIVKGKRQLHLDDLLKLSALFHKPIEWILTGKEPPYMGVGSDDGEIYIDVGPIEAYVNDEPPEEWSKEQENLLMLLCLRDEAQDECRRIKAEITEKNAELKRLKGMVSKYEEEIKDHVQSNKKPLMG